MSTTPRSLIIDTDAGFDDLVAIQCLLNTHTTLNSPLITTIGGVIAAGRGEATLRKLFPQAPIVARGVDSPIMPYDPIPGWLEHYRSTALDAFVEQFCSDRNTENTGEDANDVIAIDEKTLSEDNTSFLALSQVSDLVSKSQDNSLDILCIGPLTNLASWVDHYLEKQEIQQFTSRIHRIFILGGNHPKRATSFKDIEFNFGLDPQAARQILESPHLREKIHLVTSSVCNTGQLEISVGKQRLQDFIEVQRTKGTFFRTLLQFDASAYCLAFDAICAYAMEHPESITWDQVPVRVQVPSGLLVPASTDDHEAEGIRIATKIDLKFYLDWINTAVH